MMEKKVSVIIPIYNVEEYIEECIESVRRQSLSEIEMVCVNDGTLDSSMKIVKRLAEEDSRIVIIDKENGGLSSARNAGLKAATGEYICFLDSDDLLKEKALELLWEQAKENDACDIFFSAESFYETEELAKKHKVYKTYYQRKDVYEGIYTGQDLFCKMIAAGDFKPSVCLQFIKRSFVEQHHLRFYDGIVHEDQLFTMQLMTLAEHILYLDEMLYMRRVREESIMTKGRGIKNAYGYFITIKEAIPFIGKYENDITKEFRETMHQRLSAMCNTAAGFLKDVEEVQWQSYLEKLSVEEQLLFEGLIGNIWRQKRQAKADIKVAKEKLKKSWAYRLGAVITYLPRKIKRILK